MYFINIKASIRNILFIFIALVCNNASAQNLSIGTIPSGDSIIVLMSVTINTGTTSISKQHTISGTNFSNVLSNDPKTAAPNDPTITLVVSSGLPLTLTSFNAYQKNAAVQLEWITQQESNMDKFEIERSSNGQQFSSVGNVQANNRLQLTNYSFPDNNPFSGLNFYRLKMIDRGGLATYSQILKVDMRQGNTDIMNVYPNPLNGNTITLQVNLRKADYIVCLINSVGQKIMLKVLNHPGGAATETINLPKELAGGIYQLNLSSEDVNISRQVIKN